MTNLALASEPPALGGDFDSAAGNHLHVDHRRGVVAGIDAFAGRIFQHRGAQDIVRVGVGPVDACVDHVFDANSGVPAYVHADLQKYRDDAGVLADGSLAFGAQAGIDQYLRHRVFGGLALFLVVGGVQGPDEIRWMIAGDILQRRKNAVDEVVLADGGHCGMS